MKKKILLLHGWNWKNYTKLTKSTDAWDNRMKFVQELQSKFEVYKLNFPGFCGEPEPQKEWNLSDYAKFVKDYLDKNNLKVDYILGYSFGGAVAVYYNYLYNQNQKLILISPAITRNADKSKKMIKTPVFMQKIRNVMRDLYLIHIVKNPYMKNGTKFLNNSYQIIVRVELLDILKKLNPNMINIIYGSVDDQVNPLYVYDNVSNQLKKRITIIDGGGHDIANTHIKEIMNIIKDIS